MPADGAVVVDATTTARGGTSRWFAIEAGFAAGLAAFFASQALILLSSSGGSPILGSAIAAGLAIALIEAVVVTGFGLLAWLEVESRGLPARSRGIAVMLRVSIGTFVFGIAASGLLGSWQAWLLSTSITFVAALVGGYIAARCIWREHVERVPVREP
jgi:hypothetical protein